MSALIRTGFMQRSNACPLSARSGHRHYSITSSARSSSGGLRRCWSSHSSSSGARPLVQDLGDYSEMATVNVAGRLGHLRGQLPSHVCGDQQQVTANVPCDLANLPCFRRTTACRPYAALSECAARLMPEEEEENDDRDWNAE